MSGARSPAAVSAVARVALLRLGRSRAAWLALAICAVPLPFAGWLRDRPEPLHDAFTIARLLLAIVPAWFVAAAIGDELEHATYVWARPLARWTVIAGKLVALAPLSALLIAASWVATAAIATDQLPPAVTVVAIAACALACSLAAAGIAVLAPRFAMALTIVYVLFDLLIGELPASLRLVSLSHHATELAGFGPDPADAWTVVGLAAIALAWLAVALIRVRSREA
jgi:ABC-type transport system involved in multi-copper enzyme maturation permease subunit